MCLTILILKTNNISKLQEGPGPPPPPLPPPPPPPPPLTFSSGSAYVKDFFFHPASLILIKVLPSFRFCPDTVMTWYLVCSSFKLIDNLVCHLMIT